MIASIDLFFEYMMSAFPVLSEGIKYCKNSFLLCDVHTWLVHSGKLETVVLTLVAYFSAHTNIPPNGLQTSIEGIHIFLYNRFLLTCSLFVCVCFFADIMTLECCFKTNLRHPDCHKAQCLKSVPPPVASGQPIHSKSKAGVQY